MDTSTSEESFGVKNEEMELKEVERKIAQCFACNLSKTRTKTVPGQGNPNAEIMFIGEAPGAKEDESGVPFCGAAGKFLDEMLLGVGLERKDVFIANTLKCRPPENRDPEDSEKESCRHFLEKQFEIINPLLVIPMGRHAVATFLPGAGGITALHGRVLKRPDGKYYYPLYHPAAALHNGGLRSTLIEDFNRIPAIIKKIKDTKAKNLKENIKQPKLI